MKKFNIEGEDKEEEPLFRAKILHKLISQKMMIINYLNQMSNPEEGYKKITGWRYMTMQRVKMIVMKNQIIVELGLGEHAMIKKFPKMKLEKLNQTQIREILEAVIIE